MNEDIMYKALLEKDSSFEGAFVVAVKTTGIFCRPTCTARKPKKENVEFFPTCKDALVHGYRPCKICSPMEKIGETPIYIKTILEEINTNPSLKIKDFNLREKGIEPAKIRRWFKKNHGITFHSYQRLMRLNIAFNTIQSGEKVLNAAFDIGYESLSGFNDYFKTVMGESPTKSKNKNIINIERLETPIGPMYAAATKKGLCMLEFGDRRALENEFKELNKYLDAVILPGENIHIQTIKKELSDYFDGKLKMFSVPLDTPGTKFQKEVWQQLLKIPFGETRSYKQQATAMKKPEAVRAVANANGRNRVSIVIPCHRVIGEGGTLTGYGGGLPRKKWLLEHESKFLKLF